MIDIRVMLIESTFSFSNGNVNCMFLAVLVYLLLFRDIDVKFLQSRVIFMAQVYD